jgi:PAS domain S-box-containing protein
MRFDLTLIDRLGVPASLHDVDGSFIHMNATAERSAGFTMADMRGLRFTDPLPPEARSSVEAHFNRALAGEPTDFETVFVDGDGTQRAVRAQHLPLLEDGDVVGVLILAWDVRQPTRALPLDPPPALTPRQREILELIASGRSTAEIAQDLTLSTETVRNHLRSLLRELDAHTRVEAIAKAQRLGLLSSPPLRPKS